jgi:hypothetical protein
MSFASMADSPLVRTLDRAITRSDRLSALRARVLDAWDRLAEDEARRKRVLVWGGSAGAVLAIGVGVGLYFALRPMPKPDYENDSIYRVMKFTMLTDEFNKLPIEERWRLIGMIRERIESLSSGESTLLAAFAAGIAGKTREQLEENVSRLLVDTWDAEAKDYASVPPEDREAYIDGVFIRIHEMMDTLDDGQVSDMTPEERLAEGRRQAERDERNIREGEGPPARMLSRMYRIVDKGIGGYANPQQRIRGQQMMRDMVRRMRGQPLDGGG